MTTKKQFDLFKRECQHFINKWELNNYRVYFGHEKLDDNTGADCYAQADSYTAKIRFNKKGEQSNEQIKLFAKHEVIHLLLGRLSWQAYERFISKAEISEAEEEVVRKLEKII